MSALTIKANKKSLEKLLNNLFKRCNTANNQEVCNLVNSIYQIINTIAVSDEAIKRLDK